jgi:Tol biopolymer transport system component
MASLARARIAAAAFVVATAAAGAGVPAAWAAPGDTVLVSRATGTEGAKARGGFYNLPNVSQFSFDGRYATFNSDASNLDPDDPDTLNDVFLRDLRDNTTTLISRASGALGSKGNGESFVGDGASAGRYVVFSSFASNLDPADPDPAPDVYVRDLATAETTLVSRADGPAGAKSNGPSTRGRLSAEGRFVAFESTASNLDPADTEPDSDVFVRDLATGQTSLVTGGVADAQLAAFSDDGRHIAFLVTANPTGRRLLGDLYVQDLVSGRRSLVSRADGLDGAEANGYSLQNGVSMSANGRYVAFSSRATNLDPDDADRRGDVYVRDVEAGTTTLVSRADGRRGAKGNRSSGYGGSLSADGRSVAFTSTAWNLDPVVSRSQAALRNTYVRDLRTRRTTLANRTQSGAKGNKDSLFPSLSGNGRYMVFSTSARNFDESDRDYRYDFYVRDLRAPLPVPGRAPRSTIRSVRRIGRGGLSVTGRASDDGEVQTVEVSLTRRLPSGRCERWNALWIRTPSRRGRCRPVFDLVAHLTPRRWWRRFDGKLRPGTYELLTRAVDTAGRRERSFSKKRGNRRVFRIR